MKKSYIGRKARLKLRDDFFRRLGFNGMTMKRLFDLVSEFNFNMVDSDGRIMAFNRKNCENCNIKNENEIIGRRIPDCFPKASRVMNPCSSTCSDISAPDSLSTSTVP